jgi:hypothetical protein
VRAEDGGAVERRGKEERRLEEEKTQVHSLEKEEAESESIPEVPMGVEGLRPIDYSTNARARAHCDVDVRGEAALRLTTARLIRDERGGPRTQKWRREAAQGGEVARGFTEVEPLTIEAEEERIAREERRLDQLLPWNDEREALEERRAQPLSGTADSTGVLRGSEAGSVEKREAEGLRLLPADGPATLPGATASSSPFQAPDERRLLHLELPSRGSLATTARAHTARQSSAEPSRGKLRSSPCATSPPHSARAATSTNSHGRTAGPDVQRSVQSLLEAAGRKGLGWDLRLRLLEEAEHLDGKGETEGGRLQGASQAAKPPEAVLDVQRVQCAVVTLGSLSAGTSGPAVERPRSVRLPSSSSMRKYAERMGSACRERA